MFFPYTPQAVIFEIALPILLICGLSFFLLGVFFLFRKGKAALINAQVYKARSKKLIIGGVLIIVCFLILYGNYFLIISWLDPLVTCIPWHGQPFSVIETEEIEKSDPEWVQEVVDFSADAIRVGPGQSRDGIIIARTRSGLHDGLPIQVWRYMNKQLIPDTADAYLKAIASNKPLPENPHFVHSFTVTKVWKNWVCLNVQTLYNAGLSGGRGSNGEIWFLQRGLTGWKIEGTVTYYNGGGVTPLTIP